MSEALEFAVRAVLIGAGATALMDLWARFLKQVFGIQPLSWAMVGRWLAHLPRGRFVHQSIASAPAVRGELAIGWTAHYLIGVFLAAALIGIQGLGWARDPTPLPALAFGVGTVVLPFFMMQPGMGAGVAASKTPHPNRARLRSLLTHTVFGIGLYVSALLLAAQWRT
jgi:hypothetical protein